MTRVRVNNESYTEVTRERDPDDRWSGEDTYTSNSIDSIRVVGEKDYHDLTVGFEVEEGKDYFLLYGIYSTGDSYSHQEGCICYVDLYQDREFAEANRKILADHYHIKEGKNEWTAELLLEDGQKMPFCVPWKGYFESLTELVIEVVRAGPKRNSWRI